MTQRGGGGITKLCVVCVPKGGVVEVWWWGDGDDGEGVGCGEGEECISWDRGCQSGRVDVNVFEVVPRDKPL